MADDDDNYYYASYYSGDKICKVYDAEDSYTSFIQGALAFLALASLYIKRHNEVPRRDFFTWGLDVSKQGIGATYAHFFNMIIAAVMADNVRGDDVLEDQCAWYAINFFIDTTLGLVLSVYFLGLLNKEAEKRNWVSLKNIGVYIGDDGMRHWFIQLLSWVIILTISKFILLFVLWFFSPILAVLGAFVFGPVQSNIRLELFFVMILLPGVMNLFYFWIADTYLKADTVENEMSENVVDNEREDHPDNCVYTEMGTDRPTTEHTII